MIPYQLIETDDALLHCCTQLSGEPWLAFDTEFVGEKRFYTLICLIQITANSGNYLIDPLKINNMSPLLGLLQNPEILKITHAGENDFRLFYQQYGILPRNVFDTQVAAGLLGYRYPSGLAKIVLSFLGRELKKGFAVTDWEARPFTKNQLEYALDDVVILYPLYEKLKARLEEAGRISWVEEECARMERPDFFYQDPNHEALNSNLITNLNSKEQLFYIRLLAWRRQEAERLDISKNMVLANALIAQIVKAIKGGAKALNDNRRLPDHVTRKYGRLFEEMFKNPITPEEKAVLKQIPQPTDEDARDEILLEFLYLLMKYRCAEEEVSNAMVMPRNAIRKMKNDPAVREQILGSGWRRTLLGDDFVRWLEHYDELDLKIEGGRVTINIPN